MAQDLEKAKIAVRKSKVREEIVRELYPDQDLRPTELWDRIEDRVETSKENFYQNLNALNGYILDRVEGSRRMTLYSLTDIGRAVAEELALTKSEMEHLRSYAYESNLTVEEIEEVMEAVIRERQEE